jgi:hexosaminidase
MNALQSDVKYCVNYCVKDDVKNDVKNDVRIVKRFAVFASAALVAVNGCASAVMNTPATAAQAMASGDATISIIPRPAQVSRGAGEFTVTAATEIWTDAGSVAMGRQLARYLEPATGYVLNIRSGGTPGSGIVLRRDPSLARLGPEGYALDITPAQVLARAASDTGLFYALQTIRQLLPPAIFREARVTNVAWTMPAVSIEDRPRFAWRGSHLDVARHFMPKEFVKKHIDLLALHKMNVFHWHLTEDQGWRLEIRKYPRLTEIGGWRKQTLVGRQQGSRDTTAWQFDGIRHGGFYTQDDAREIVAYAAARFITVVPEIEMPGHALAAIAAYPELGIDPTRQLEVGTRFGVYSDILNADATTVAFMQDVLSEVLDIFPGQFIHIGGDEADKAQWRTSERIQARIRELGLKDEHELQSWFIHQMDNFLTARGRRLVGWDEILDGGLAPNATVMSWRGTQGGLAAARAKHDVVMAPNGFTYLDHYQSRNTAVEPIAIGGFLPLERVYSFEPVPAELEPEFARHILGAQAQLWTEYMKEPKKVEYMAWPRLAAIAEVVWTPVAQKDYAGFLGRLGTHTARLRALDVGFREIDR